MSQYVRSSTRWAIYFRDNRACVYCGISLAQVLKARDGNFLTLDHVLPQSKGGEHSPENMVTSCYDCNRARGSRSIAQFEKSRGLARQCLSRRVMRRCAKDIEPFREAARLALGEVPGFPISPTVLDHDFLVRGQWSSSDFDAAHWEHLRKQERLFCDGCGRPRDQTPEEPAPLPTYEDDQDIPF